MHILYGILMMAGGTGIVMYAMAIYRMFGRLDWAEKYLGIGGTVTAWKMIGIILIGAGMWMLVHGF